MPAMRTRRKRRVGQKLTDLRKGAGRSVEDAARLLERNESNFYKAENGYLLFAHAEMVALLMYYEVPENDHEEVLALWRDAKQDSKRIQGASAVPQDYRTFLRAEADADSVRNISCTAIPGLLQTDDYWRHVQHAGRHVSNTDVAKALTALHSRRKLLTDASPLHIHTLIDEGVIRRVVGGPEVMAAQLGHLLSMMRLPNVTIQVIPETAGAYGTMSGPLTILGYDDPQDPATAYAEHTTGGGWIDNKEDVEGLITMFDDVKDNQTLTDPQSVALIEARIVEVEGLNA